MKVKRGGFRSVPEFAARRGEGRRFWLTPGLNGALFREGANPRPCMKSDKSLHPAPATPLQPDPLDAVARDLLDSIAAEPLPQRLVAGANALQKALDSRE
jgi:hypothetical protein